MKEIQFTEPQLEMIEWALGGMDIDLYPPPQYQIPFQMEDLPKLLDDPEFRWDLYYRLEEQFPDMAEQDYDLLTARNHARAAVNASDKIREAYDE